MIDRAEEIETSNEMKLNCLYKARSQAFENQCDAAYRGRPMAEIERWHRIWVYLNYNVLMLEHLTELSEKLVGWEGWGSNG